MLRVAMITDHADSGRAVDGGVQAVTRHLVDALVRRGDLELHVIGFNYGIRDARTTGGAGYTRHTLPGAAGGALTGYWKDQQRLNELLTSIKPDVVHGQGAGQNGIVAIRSGYPTVITIHGIMAEEAKFYTGLSKRLRHRLLGKWSDRYCIRRGRHTILISPYVAEYFRDRLAGKRYMIPNPIAEDFFHVQRADDGRRILFAGRLYALKGVIDLVRAVGKLAGRLDVELVLAGSLHDRRYVEELKAEAARLQIGDRVQFLGLLDGDELRRELAHSAVLVLPSRQESAPLVITEAMAAGVPVVATNVGGVKHMVREHETGFVIEPGNVAMLAERLERLLTDETLRTRFGSAAKRHASDDYRPDQVAARTIEVYKEALDSAAD